MSRILFSIVMMALMAGPAMANSVHHPVEKAIDFSVQFDDDALASLANAGLPTPAISGTVVYDANALDSGLNFQVINLGEGFLSLNLAVTNRQEQSGGGLVDLPDLLLDETDHMGQFAPPVLVFTDGVLTSVGFETIGDTFEPTDLITEQGAILVGEGIVPGQGRGVLVFSAPRKVGGDTNVVPTPGAAAAGLFMLGVVGMRRRRSSNGNV